MSNNIQRHTVPGIVMAIIGSMVSLAMPASAGVRPQLVIGIMVDGLDQQYLDLLRGQFGPGGFNRLMEQGVVIPNADYGTGVDATAAAAMLATGAPPSTTSISGAMIYDRAAGRAVPAMNDPEAMGNFTPQTYSPRALSASTLSDEVKIAGGGVTRTFSIAPDPAQAVILAGHNANSAIWLNEKTGNWATSTFYKDFPTSVTYRNRVTPLSARLDTMRWTPALAPDRYPGLPEHLTHYPFSYVFPRGSADRYAMFAASPKCNTEVTDIATLLIDDLKLGTTTDGADMINLTYTLAPFDFTRNEDNRYELMDSYIRLDRDLARLFSAADRAAGAGNTLFYLAATPPTGRVRRDNEKWNIPFGEFSTKKAKSLLNMFLIAKYGNGDWVKAFYDKQFYLNNQLIDERHLDAREVRLESAAFLEKMSGVDHVYTVDEILAGRGDAHYEALQRNTHAASSGDLFIEVAPGWETVDDLSAPVQAQRTQYVRRAAPATAPVFILAPNVESRTINTPVDIRAVAPTVARLLRIRSPNAASLPPVVL